MDYGRIYSDINAGRLTRLGQGGGRRVYDMGNGYVVKLARNRFGLRQNKHEYEVSLKSKGNLLAKVLSVSEGYNMLIMQAARPLEGIEPVLEYFHVKTRNGLAYVPELVALVKKHRLVMREFLVSRNWGLIHGKPVIIDYGFARRKRRFL